MYHNSAVRQCGKAEKNNEHRKSSVFKQPLLIIRGVEVWKCTLTGMQDVDGVAETAKARRWHKYFVKLNFSRSISLPKVGGRKRKREEYYQASQKQFRALQATMSDRLTDG